MKKFIAFIFIIGSVMTVNSQELNKVVVDTSINEEILFGYCNRDGFSNDLFSDWFNTEYDSYKVDEKTLGKLDFENNPQPEITIVMGTWCHDSQREIPRFYKILDKLEYDEDNLTLITVDRKKTAGDVPVASLNIELVPTIIVYENGEEKGRIIETPEKSLEKDLAKILAHE